jgi:hypothetical protein
MSTLGRPAARAPINTGDIPDGIITSAKVAADVLTAADIAPNAVTNSEMADDAVGIAELSATGTAGTTTFLRGDNTWTVVDTEGTGIKSTGESGGTKFLREDGDGTSSWAVAGSPSISDGGNATAITIDSNESVTLAGTLAVTNPTSLTSLKPVSNQNLTGTYSDHEMIIGDQFTLTGDLNINDNLVLASLSGSGQDITITDDGLGRTITTAGKVLSCTTTNTDATVTTASTADLRAGKGVTGTGIAAGATIASVTNATTFELSAVATASGTVNLTFDTGIFEAGEFLGTVPPQTDISTMTSGILPASALTNATFPTGHVINAYQINQAGGLSANSSTATIIPGLTKTLTPVSSTSKFLFIVTASGHLDSGTDTAHEIDLFYDGVSLGPKLAVLSSVYGITYNNLSNSLSFTFLHAPATTSSITYDVRARVYFGSGNMYWYQGGAHMTIMEIAS